MVVGGVGVLRGGGGDVERGRVFCCIGPNDFQIVDGWICEVVVAVPRESLCASIEAPPIIDFCLIHMAT